MCAGLRAYRKSLGCTYSIDRKTINRLVSELISESVVALKEFYVNEEFEIVQDNCMQSIGGSYKLLSLLVSTDIDTDDAVSNFLITKHQSILDERATIEANLQLVMENESAFVDDETRPKKKRKSVKKSTSIIDPTVADYLPNSIHEEDEVVMEEEVNTTKKRRRRQSNKNKCPTLMDQIIEYPSISNQPLIDKDSSEDLPLVLDIKNTLLTPHAEVANYQVVLIFEMI